MLRVKGPGHDKVREIAKQVETVMAANPSIKSTNLNWYEQSKIVHLEIDQDKARKLGVASQSLAASLQAQLSGSPISEFRENDKTISMVFRFDAEDRNDPSRLKDLSIHIGNGKYVPLDQIAKVSFAAEEGLIYRYNLKPMIIVQAEIHTALNTMAPRSPALRLLNLFPSLCRR